MRCREGNHLVPHPLFRLRLHQELQQLQPESLRQQQPLCRGVSRLELLLRPAVRELEQWPTSKRRTTV